MVNRIHDTDGRRRELLNNEIWYLLRHWDRKARAWGFAYQFAMYGGAALAFAVVLVGRFNPNEPLLFGIPVLRSTTSFWLS